jgi:flotillin
MKTLSGFAAMFATVFFAGNLPAAGNVPADALPFDLGGLFVPVIVVVCVLAVLIAISLFLRNYIKVPPNKVAIISGRKHKLSTGETIGFRLVRGGATFKWPLLERVDYLGLDVLSIAVAIKKAITLEGVPLNVAAIANVKFGSDDVSLRNAAERFLNMSEDAIEKIILNTLEGHLRSICCTLTVEQINSDRQKFAQQMVGEAAVDLQRMGIVIDALVVQHIEDEQQYLTSLGLKRTAEVQRDAKIVEPMPSGTPTSGQRRQPALRPSSQQTLSVKARSPRTTTSRRSPRPSVILRSNRHNTPPR